jgi:hypothetical protein
LPPQQSFDYQADVGGEIRLARSGRTRCSTQHKQATSRQRPQIPAHQVSEPSAHPVAHDCRAYRLAHDETNQRRPRIVFVNQQVPGHQRPSRPAPGTGRGRKVRTPPHPGDCWKHHVTSRQAITR